MFPALGLFIFGKGLFPGFKVGMMDRVSALSRLHRRANAMEHFMIYDVRDKVRGKMRLVEQTVDLDAVGLKAEKPQLSMPPRSPLSIPKPGDLQI